MRIPAKRDTVLSEFLENETVLLEGGQAHLLLRQKRFAQLVLQKASFADGFSCSLSGVLLVLMEKPSLGISHKLLLFPSLMEQEAALLHTLLWDVLGWCCSGTRQLAGLRCVWTAWWFWGIR